MSTSLAAKDVQDSGCCRRDFLKGSLSCGAYTLMALAATTTANRRAFAQATAGEPVAEAPFARVDKISDGVWSVVSTPLQGDLTTISNGGIIAGDDAVVAIEGFQSVEGGAWLRDLCKDLTGRYPTHVVLTHYHPDHSNGLAGYFNGASAPSVISTAGTRDLLIKMYDTLPTQPHGDSGLSDVSIAGVSPVVGVASVVPATVLNDETQTATLDLGGKKITMSAHVGHTPSDMAITLDDPHVTWCGDLFFNGMFPNYRDAVPISLGKTCKGLLADASTVYIPGHGAIANDSQIRNYLGLLETVEEAARAGLKSGKSPKEIAEGFEVPQSLGEWFVFAPDLYEVAFTAWQRNISA